MAHADERRGGSHRRGFLAGLAVGAGAVALAWLGVAQWQRAFAPPPASIQVVSTFSRSDSLAETPPAPAAPAAAAAPAPTPEPETVTPPGGAKYTIEMPVYAKLVARPLSREPHQVLGAWDEDEAAASPGQRRAFVLAVSPGQSDASLESLARDVRAQNLDALLLDVRVYDDAGAAIGPKLVDSGRSARQHLVAEIQRNPAAGLDVIRVRGRALEP
jgi:hypothetical protein